MVVNKFAFHRKKIDSRILSRTATCSCTCTCAFLTKYNKKSTLQETAANKLSLQGRMIILDLPICCKTSSF